MSLYGVGAGVGGTVPVWGTHEPELWLQAHGWTDVRTGKLQTQSGDSAAWAHLTTGETEIQSHSIHCSLGMPAHGRLRIADCTRGHQCFLRALPPHTHTHTYQARLHPWPPCSLVSSLAFWRWHQFSRPDISIPDPLRWPWAPLFSIHISPCHAAPFLSHSSVPPPPSLCHSLSPALSSEPRPCTGSSLRPAWPRPGAMYLESHSLRLVVPSDTLSPKAAFRPSPQASQVNK